MGDLEQAKDYFARALDIYLKKLGPEHVVVGDNYKNLGALQNDLGHGEEAKEC